MASTGDNSYISNGTCYSAAGEELGDAFIPCGNAADGPQTCCGKGDKCLADSACFGKYSTGYGSDLTYMVGCTDPDYESSACPKKFFGQLWEALTLCDNSDGAWAPCSQEGNPTTLQPGSFCSCTDASKTTVAFKDATVLEDFASLPQSTGGTIQFLNGNTPTAAPTSEAGAPSASAGTTGSNLGASETGSNAASGSGTPAQTGSNGASGTAAGSATGSAAGSGASSGPTGGGNSSNQQDSGGSSGLASGAKIGIGVGVSLGVLLLLVALALLFLRRRRRRSKGPTSSEAGSITKEKPLKPVTTPPVPEVDGQPVSEADGRAAKPWALRSELEGTNVYTAANLRNQDGSNMVPHPDAAELPVGSPGGQETQTEGGRYIPYRPPPGHAAETGGPGANGMAEMSAVKTPPAA